MSESSINVFVISETKAKISISGTKKKKNNTKAGKGSATKTFEILGLDEMK